MLRQVECILRPVEIEAALVLHGPWSRVVRMPVAVQLLRTLLCTLASRNEGRRVVHFRIWQANDKNQANDIFRMCLSGLRKGVGGALHCK